MRKDELITEQLTVGEMKKLLSGFPDDTKLMVHGLCRGRIMPVTRIFSDKVKETWKDRWMGYYECVARGGEKILCFIFESER